MLFTSCAKSIYVNYQEETTNTGVLVIQPNRSTAKTYVTIDDSLIVEKKIIKKLTIRNIPEGVHLVNYVSENSALKEPLRANINIEVEAGKVKTKLVEVPPYSTGYYISMTLYTLLMILVLPAAIVGLAGS